MLSYFIFYCTRLLSFLLGLIIFGVYWILKKTGHKVAGVILSSVLVFAILSAAIFFAFEDSFFSKSDATELLSKLIDENLSKNL